MEHSVLRKTKSLSPATLKEIDAQVILEDGVVYLQKQDEEGTLYKTRIEGDAGFYQQMVSETVSEQVPPNCLFLYVSSKCNLNCPICYEDKNTANDLSLDEIETILKGSKNQLIALIGREPTCREDFPEIVKLASKHNRACLNTNGLKLADYDYVRTLKEAGLDTISLSFNGFDDEIYKKMKGRPLLDIMLKALENIKKAGIKTVISLTLAKGVNENQIRQICDYCFDNRDFIYELRVRSVSPVGRHIDVDSYCISDMFDLMAKELRISKEDIVNQQAFWHECIKELDWIIPFSVKTFYRKRVCASSFHLRKNGSYSILAGDFNLESFRKSKFKKIRLVYHMIKSYGLSYIFQNICLLFKLPLKFEDPHNMLVVLRSWPNLLNIDLEENKKCSSQYYKHGKFLPFCLRNIIGGNSSSPEQSS